MDKKVMIIAAVAVVAVVAIAAVAVVMMNNNNSEKDYNAKELAEKFVKDYEGKEFGEFKVSDDASETSAKLTATCKKVARNGSDLGNRDKDTVIEITHYETKDDAKKAFLDAITNSANGTKGKTLLTQQDKLGMANSSVTIVDLREDSASKYGADNAFLFYAAYIGTTMADQQFTMCAGALLDGKNVISFNTSTYSVYLPKAINASPSEGEVYISDADYESLLVAFCKAF